MKKATKKRKINLSLPWPPSVNAYWRPNGRGGLRVTKAGTDYQSLVRMVFIHSGETFSSPVGVRAVALGPTVRRYDLDNLLKASLDALTKAQVWKDDRLVDQLTIVRGPRTRPPRIDFLIWEL